MSYEIKGFGCIPSDKDIRDYKLNAKLIKVALDSVPTSFKLTDLHVKSQGNKPTCTAHATSEIIEYCNQKETGEYVRFSTDFIYGLRDQYYDYQGPGMKIRDALKVAQDYGDVPYQDFPGNYDANVAKRNVETKLESLKEEAYKNRISTYFRLKTPYEIKYTLYKYGNPIIVGMWWPHNVKLSSGGILEHTDFIKDQAHAVIIVGYDSKYWLLQNSWGKSWGARGLFRVPISETENLFFDIYGVTDNIENIKTPNKIIKKLSSLINKFLNRK